jgi:Mg/Co/Ni transporter MgtE
MGSITFPLDWRVCWKEPPISHSVGLVCGSILGSVLDLIAGRNFRMRYEPGSSVSQIRGSVG